MYTREELDIKKHIEVLRRRQSVVVLFFVTVVTVVALGSFIMRPTYRAKTTLLIDLESPNVLTTSGMVEIQQQNYYSYKEYYQSQQEIIASLPIIKKVFDEFKLGDSKSYGRAKEPIKKFLKTVKVEPVRDTRLLELYVENKDPVLAARIANRIAEIYVTRNLYYISKNELLNLLKNEYLKFDTRLSEYSKIYKEGHPEMVRLKEEMKDVIDNIEREKGSAVNQDYVVEEGLLAYKKALEGLKANNVSILALAEVPVVPIKPKKLLNIVLAMVIGIVGGAGLAFLFEYLDDTVKDSEDLSLTKWPYLGSIPQIDGKSPMNEFERDIVAHVKLKDPVTEAYRSIRTSVLFSATEDHPLKSVVVTSCLPQEGKTTTLCNLGITIAQNHKRVLLVDADMRKPRLHEVFKKDNDMGLSNLLAGQASFNDVIKKTDIENISLITGGILPPNPSELLASNKAKEFIAKAKEGFDFVLLDTPPVGILTDAVIASRIADGVVVVVESAKTSKRILRRVHHILTETKARVIGFIINRSSAHVDDYYYYHSHYYGKTGKEKEYEKTDNA